jgi:hypothetical protein
MDDIFVGSVAEELIITVGATLSYSLVIAVAAVLLLPAASVATDPEMFTVTVPAAVGVILAV